MDRTEKTEAISGITLLIFILFVFGVLWFTNQFDQREREITWEDFTKLTQEGEGGVLPDPAE